MADDAHYARFRRSFNERIEQYVALTPAQLEQEVRELREGLGGEPVASVPAGILPADPSPAGP
ncbi:hypothetical protein ACFZB9_25240 [Kitasatospora sp. NPDC008050]|uniref:hypothetical protein n=1 Tax=Kitasatospora sp. NPDC008050 TaxID=3364021 RepID=UPI0036EF34F9